MTEKITPVLIPGLICTGDLFRHQLDELATLAASDSRLANPVMADTLSHDSLKAMAEAALDEVEGGLLPIGLSMGGYVTMEMARLAPDRVSGMALLSTSHKADTPERSQQRAATIKMAAGKGFRGVTRHLLGSFLSAQAMADEALVARVIQMAQDVGSATFVNQQKAIMARRDQTPTLQGFAGKALVLCGLEDTLTPPALSEDMARLVPDARLVLLPDVGHLSSLEAPQLVTDAIIDLLNEVIAARV